MMRHLDQFADELMRLCGSAPDRDRALQFVASIWADGAMYTNSPEDVSGRQILLLEAAEFVLDFLHGGEVSRSDAGILLARVRAARPATVKM